MWRAAFACARLFSSDASVRSLCTQRQLCPCEAESFQRDRGDGYRETADNAVRAPGTKADGLGSGLVGDTIGDRANHGGDEQAVYAYPREELDHWQEVLGRELPSGTFGENLTTTGLDISGALIGERWQIGDEVVLQVTCPRIPCSTFRGWINETGWLKTLTAAAMPGAYLSVVTPGFVRSGDLLAVVHRPGHEVTVATVFRALTLEPNQLPSILATADLPSEARSMASQGRTFSLY